RRFTASRLLPFIIPSVRAGCNVERYPMFYSGYFSFRLYFIRNDDKALFTSFFCSKVCFLFCFVDLELHIILFRYINHNRQFSIITNHIGLSRSEEHTSELQSRENLVCRLLLEKKNNEYYRVFL